MLILITGLPGSGKSTLLNSLTSVKPVFRVEDFMKGVVFIEFARSLHFPRLLDALHRGEDFAADDCAWCEQHRRDDVVRAILSVVPKSILRWEFFANDLEKCKTNIKARHQTRSRQDIVGELRYATDLSERYTIPIGSQPHQVWSPS